MRYIAPDYERVQMRVETLFADYTCTEKSYEEWAYTVPCKGTADYALVTRTYTSTGQDGCWVNNVG